MTGRIYYFNPAHDMALANNTPFYMAPDEIVRMTYDLAVLPAWYAREGKVKIDEWRQVELLRSQIGCAGLFPDVQWTLEWESGEYMPWGWDPALLRTLRLAGVSEDCLLTDPQMERIRGLSGRQHCVEMLELLGKTPGVCGEARVCGSLQEVRYFMSEVGEVVLKSPWSGSGRGLLKVSPATWTDSVEGWVRRVLRTQGGIMAEPLYEKVRDFAMEFFVDGAGGLFFLGYSLFDTDLHGNYKENRLLSDDRIVRILSAYVPAGLLEQVRSELMAGLSSLLKNDYKGYLGVDMMICRVDGTFRIHPCVEINLRMNMGIVAHMLCSSLVHPRSEGVFRLEHYSREGEAQEASQALRAASPLRVSDGRVLSGYFPLNGLEPGSRYHAYIEVEDNLCG